MGHFGSLSDLSLASVLEFLYGPVGMASWSSAPRFHELLLLRTLRPLGAILDASLECVRVTSAGARQLALTGRGRKFPRLRVVESALWTKTPAAPLQAAAVKGAPASVDEVEAPVEDDGPDRILLSWDGSINNSMRGFGTSSAAHYGILALPELAIQAFFAVVITTLNLNPQLVPSIRILFFEALHEDWSMPSASCEVDAFDFRHVLVAFLKSLCLSCRDIIERASSGSLDGDADDDDDNGDEGGEGDGAEAKARPEMSLERISERIIALLRAERGSNASHCLLDHLAWWVTINDDDVEHSILQDPTQASSPDILSYTVPDRSLRDVPPQVHIWHLRYMSSLQVPPNHSN